MTGPHRLRVALAWTAIATAGADSLGVNTALRSIQGAGIASGATLVWVLLAHLLAQAAALPAGERISARMGTRWTLIAGSLVYAAASTACAVAGNAGELLAARAVQGAGSGLAVAAVLGLLGAGFPPDTPGAAKYRAAPGFALALAGGPLVDGAVAAGPGWRWIFIVDTVLGWSAAAVAWRALDPDQGRQRHLDVEGPVVALLAVGAPVWALLRAVLVGWAAPEVLGALVLGTAALVTVLMWDMPSGPRHRRTFLAANAADLCLFASVYGTEFLVATDLRGVGGLGPLGVGLRLTPWTAVMAVAMLWPVRDRGDCSTQRGWGSALGPALHAVGLIWLATLVPGGRSWLAWPMPLVLSGVGAGLALSQSRWAVPGLAVSARPVRARARAVPLAGAAVGVAVGAAVAGFGGRGVTPEDRGLVRALYWAAALAVVAAVARLAVPSRRCPQMCPATPGPGRSAMPMTLSEPRCDPREESRNLFAALP